MTCFLLACCEECILAEQSHLNSGSWPNKAATFTFKHYRAQSHTILYETTRTSALAAIVRLWMPDATGNIQPPALCARAESVKPLLPTHTNDNV